MKNQKRTNLGIVIAGLPAVGKTTIAQELAMEFNINLYNGGDILKMLANEKGYATLGNDWWDTREAKKFMSERRSNPLFDKEVDQKLVELVKSGNVIITSYTLPWLAPQSLKFWLKGSLSNRAKRMANRDNIAVDTAVEIIQERDIENTGIYRKLYGFEFGSDLSVFDFILNTDLLCLDSLIEISKSIIREIVI
ncbi:MAG: cytidylate kinase family protein [Nitrososphaeraceae archaeon]